MVYYAQIKQIVPRHYSSLLLASVAMAVSEA
jgi:hypothetical protein